MTNAMKTPTPSEVSPMMNDNYRLESLAIENHNTTLKQGYEKIQLWTKKRQTKKVLVRRKYWWVWIFYLFSNVVLANYTGTIIGGQSAESPWSTSTAEQNTRVNGNQLAICITADNVTPPSGTANVWTDANNVTFTLSGSPYSANGSLIATHQNTTGGNGRPYRYTNHYNGSLFDLVMNNVVMNGQYRRCLTNPVASCTNANINSGRVLNWTAGCKTYSMGGDFSTFVTTDNWAAHATSGIAGLNMLISVPRSTPVGTYQYTFQYTLNNQLKASNIIRYTVTSNCVVSTPTTSFTIPVNSTTQNIIINTTGCAPAVAKIISTNLMRVDGLILADDSLGSILRLTSNECGVSSGGIYAGTDTLINGATLTIPTRVCGTGSVKPGSYSARYTVRVTPK